MPNALLCRSSQQTPSWRLDAFTVCLDHVRRQLQDTMRFPNAHEMQRRYKKLLASWARKVAHDEHLRARFFTPAAYQVRGCGVGGEWEVMVEQLRPHTPLKPGECAQYSWRGGGIPLRVRLAGVWEDSAR